MRLGGDYSEQVEKKKKRFESLLGENLVISSEYLFSFSSEEIMMLKEYLLSKGYTDFLIVLYLREPESYYKSFIQQRVKWSNKVPTPHAVFSDWIPSIESWSKAFSNLSVKKFDRTHLVKGDVVADFQQEMSNFFQSSIDLEGKISNQSLCLEALFLLERMNREVSNQNTDIAKGRNEIIEQMTKLSTAYTAVKLSNQAVNLVSFYSVDIRKYLFDKFSLEFGEYGTVDSIHDETHWQGLSSAVISVNPESMLSFSAELMSRLIIK